MYMFMDKISVTPPSESLSISLDPRFKASLESQWRNALIIKVVGRSVCYTISIIVYGS